MNDAATHSQLSNEWCEGGYVGVHDEHQGTDRATCPSCGRSVRFHRITGRFKLHLRPVPGDGSTE